MTDQSNTQEQFAQKREHVTILEIDDYNPDSTSERYFKHKGRWLDYFDINQRIRFALNKTVELMQRGDRLTITIEIHRHAQDVQKKEHITTLKYMSGQKLMMDWCELMKNFTPYDSGVGKEAWDVWHARLKAETSQFLANPPEWPDNEFMPQIQSLQQLVSEWLGEK